MPSHAITCHQWYLKTCNYDDGLLQIVHVRSRLSLLTWPTVYPRGYTGQLHLSRLLSFLQEGNDLHDICWRLGSVTYPLMLTWIAENMLYFLGKPWETTYKRMIFHPIGGARSMVDNDSKMVDTVWRSPSNASPAKLHAPRLLLRTA